MGIENRIKASLLEILDNRVAVHSDYEQKPLVFDTRGFL